MTDRPVPRRSGHGTVYGAAVTEMPRSPQTFASRQLAQGMARSRLVGWSMWLVYAGIVAQAAVLVWVLRVLDRLGSGRLAGLASPATQDVLDELNGPVTGVTTVVTVFTVAAVLLTGVATLRWAGLARVIAESSGAVRMRYGSVARVLCWLVPFWNWFGPKQVVNDLWAASDPGAGLRVDVLESTPPRWLLCWWVPWIAGPLVIWSGTRVVTGSTPAGIRIYEYMLILALALSAVAGAVFVRIVASISRRQLARASNLGFLLG